MQTSVLGTRIENRYNMNGRSLAVRFFAFSVVNNAYSVDICRKMVYYDNCNIVNSE